MNIRRGHSFTQVDFAGEHPLQARIAEHCRDLSPMLVLSRRGKEGIQIGDDIFVNVDRLRSAKVWLGIKAPMAYPIFKLNADNKIQVADPKPGDKPKKIRWNLEKLNAAQPLVVVTVTLIDGWKTRLGFEAPDNIGIMRNELLTDTSNPGAVELQGEVHEKGFGLILDRQEGEKIGIWAPDPSFSIDYKERVSKVH